MSSSMGRSVLSILFVALVFSMIAVPSASAQGAGVGIKGGLLFPDFSTDDFDLDDHTGFQVGP